VNAGCALALLVLFAPALAGCNGLHKRDAEDPLVGPGPKGLKADPGTTTKTHSQVPPVPAANSSASNADLATGGQLAGGRPLGIDDRRPGGGWQGVGPNGQPVRAVSAGDGGIVPASGGVILQRPEPLGDAPAQPLQPAASTDGLTPVPAITYGQPLPQQHPTPTPTLTVDQLRAELKARGGTILREEVTRDGVFIACSVPERFNPDRQHIYEHTGPDPVSTLQALLAKIASDR
jgi:hypothetical protein